ncbi:hypothetical protein [Paenibacillus sp. MBLB4367]|uniref:hypothetical protein n=1 Tax=Paenibacillus sp. MBLB4367 TaxID=3384767 RepID=UPI0039080C12
MKAGRRALVNEMASFGATDPTGGTSFLKERSQSRVGGLLCGKWGIMFPAISALREAEEAANQAYQQFLSQKSK